jgi:peroxiredoxin
MWLPIEKIPRRLWIGVVLTITALVAGLMVWRTFPTVSLADEGLESRDRIFDKLGMVQIPRIPPPADFVLPDLNGRKVRLSDYRGKVVLLNFWATWCPDCRIEMPALESLHQHFKDRSFVMLGVDLRESQKDVQQFFERYKLSFSVLLDSDGQVGHSFGIRSIPTSFIVDQSGGMIGKAIGSRKWDSAGALALFEQLINHPPDRQGIDKEESR